VYFWFPRSSVGTHTSGCRSKTGMHSHVGAVGTSIFLVPTVLRGNPYLGLPKQDRYAFPGCGKGTEKRVFFTICVNLLDVAEKSYKILALQRSGSSVG